MCDYKEEEERCWKRHTKCFRLLKKKDFIYIIETEGEFHAS